MPPPKPKTKKLPTWAAVLIVVALLGAAYVIHRRRKAAAEASTADTPLPVADPGLYPMYGSQGGWPLGGQNSTVPGPQGAQGPPGPSPYCTDSTTCPTGYTCISGLCQKPTNGGGGGGGGTCKKDKDCPTHEHCKHGKCEPKQGSSNSCDPPCVAPKTCSQGQCVTPAAPGSSPHTPNYDPASAHGHPSAQDKGKHAKVHHA